MSSRRRFVAILFSIAVAAAGCADVEIPQVAALPTQVPTAEPTPSPVPTVPDVPTPTPAPFVGESGITIDTIRIAVVADGPAGLEIDQDAEDRWQAVEAWAESVNTGGRLAGRTVVVERLDSAIFRHADAIDRVCNGDFFAVVGSSSLNDSDGLELLTSAGCGVPDFPSRVSTLERLESELTFVSNPTSGDLWNAGWASYFVETAPEAVEAAGTVLAELPAVVVAGQRMIEAATAQGYSFVASPVAALDTDYTAEAQALIDADVRLLTWRNSGPGLLRLLDAVAEIDPEYAFDVIDCGQACYDPAWVEAAGAQGNGVQVWLPVVPIEEADVVSELTRYLFFMGGVHGDDAILSPAGLEAWSAALLFEEAVNRAVGSGTPDYAPDSLTASALVAAARTIDAWDARGLHGVADPSTGAPAPCLIVLVLANGTWARTFPDQRGELSCSDDYLVPLVATGGAISVTPTPTPAAEEPTPEPTPVPDDE